MVKSVLDSKKTLIKTNFGVLTHEFPNWQRPGEKLKKYWNNFKDGAAFKVFRASIGK
jgi:hypothetical protein